MSPAAFDPAYLSRGLGPGRLEDLPKLFRFYWQSCTFLQTFFEDVEGVDGREAYLQNLKLRLIEVLYDMDESLGSRPPVPRGHRLAVALEVGCRAFTGHDGPALTALFFDGEADTDAEVERIRALGEQLLAGVPGDLRAALDNQGQRYILGMLRSWSKLSAETPAAMDEIRNLMKNL